jgi:hypothetical protein
MGLGYTRQQLRQAQRLDQAVARERGAVNRFGKSGRLTRQVSLTAFMNAVNGEGREVGTSRDAEGYWKDMERLYPWIKTHHDISVPAAGAMRNRHGRVSERRIYGRTGHIATLGRASAKLANRIHHVSAGSKP